MKNTQQRRDSLKQTELSLSVKTKSKKQISENINDRAIHKLVMVGVCAKINE